MKLIISTIIGLLALAVIWYYVPEPTRNKVITFTDKALQRDSSEIPAFAREEFLPKDPAEKRELLIGELKKNVEDIKKGLLAQAGTELPKSIIESEKLLAELEHANKEKTITTGVLDRALDLVLPSRAKECVPSKGD